MERYGDWRPTGFDSRGLGLPEQQDWFVVGVMQTRDSGVLDHANFRAALESLGGESDTVEVHRFGHWGPGWFEIILIHPSREAEGEAIECSLAYYPILDESLYCEMEYEQELEDWSAYGESDFRRELKRSFTLSDATNELLMGTPSDVMFAFHREQSDGGEPWRDGEGFDFSYVKDIERDTLAAWLWQLRREAKAA